MRLLGTAPADQMDIRRAAWVARCVGRSQAAPLTLDALTALAATLTPHRMQHGSRPAEAGRLPRRLSFPR